MADDSDSPATDTDQKDVTVATVLIDRTSSDYAMLINYLRARLRDHHSGTYQTDRVFMTLGEDSPLYWFVYFASLQLVGLKIVIQSVIYPAYSHAEFAATLLPNVSRDSLRTALAMVNKEGLDLRRLFTCQLRMIQRVYTLTLIGSSNGSQTVTCVLSDPYLKFIRLSEELNAKALQPGQSGSAVDWLIRDDRTVSLRSLLAYYGVAIPVKANRADLAQAIADLLPAERSAPSIGREHALPFTLPEQPRFVLNTSQLYSFRQRTVEEDGADDYNVIEQEIRKESQWQLKRYRNLLDSYTHFGASLETNEIALLDLLQRAGGITLKLLVYDSDGQDDIYREQHTVNPWTAETLAQYFTKAEDELSAYMINTIQYREGEGAINIEKLVVEMIVPNVVLRSHPLPVLHIQAFNLRSKEPPFLYLDSLSTGAYDIINDRFAAITDELRKGNWDIGRCQPLKDAAQYLLRHYQQDPASQFSVTYLQCLNESANIYYSVVAQGLEAQQQLKVILQPTQPEFVSRAVCRYLGLEEFNWGVIAQATFDIRYEASWKNTGTFVRFAKSAGYRTLLSVVYDEDLRREIGLADNFDELLQQLAQAISNACKYTGDTKSLKAKLTGVFDTNIAFVENGDLPDDLTKPKEALASQVETYTLKATDDFRALEAERILLTSGDAAVRLLRIDLGNPANTDKAVYCIELLTASENDLLETRVNAFAAFLRARANNDDIQDMCTSAQHVLQVVHQVAGLIPVLGNFINLGFDLYSEDVEAIALDGVNIFAELLLECRTLPPRVLGTLMLQGANIWMMSQQVAALKAAVKANDYSGSVTHFGFLLMGMHSALHCGISVIHGLDAAAVEPVVQVADDAPSVVPLADKESSGRQHGPGYGIEATDRAKPEAASAYWSVDTDGHICERPSGRKISTLDWNGNAVVEGGARGILLGGISEDIYMLNGLAHRTVMGVAGPELRPLHTLDIEAGQWKAISRQGVASDLVAFSRFAHSEAFPAAFSGRPERPQAQANAVSWYDNCVATLDDVSTEVTDLEGRTTHTTLPVGVIEHKYITERDGHVEVLEHAGRKGGKTRLIRGDGSEWLVSRTLPAVAHYKPEIQARIIAAKGMFVVVEIRDTVQGLVGKKIVAGVVATRAQGGGQELVIEADRGVHYRGTLAPQDVLALVPGETSTDQKPIELTLSKINPEADPKRASPHLYLQADYRDSLAHDDFALELFYGAKAANEAYARNPQWVTDNVAAVSKIKAQLPTSITTVDNPFYVLDTQSEHAILFAPRNQAALANTLLGKTIEWGASSSARAVGVGEKLLRKLRLGKPLLTSAENIAALAADRISLVQHLKQTLGQKNLLLAEVEDQSGAKVYFAHSAADNLRVAADAGAEEIYLSSSGSIIDRVEAHYPDPSAIKNIVVLSVTEVSEADCRRIFVSSQRGYKYESVTSLEAPAVKPELTGPELQLRIREDQYAERARHITIPSDSVDLSSATFVETGPRRGSFSINAKEYVKLDNGKLYRAHWDGRHNVFVLVPPEGKLLANLWGYPWVRYASGREFTLINRPGLKGGNWQAGADEAIRTRNYARSTVASGRFTSAQLRNSAELQVHHQDVHVFHDDTALQNRKLNVPGKLFGSSRVNRSGYVTLQSMIEVPQSCISSTELLVSRYAGGTSEFDYAGERLGEATALVPNVEVVALQGDQEVSLNISTTELDDFVGKQGHSDYFTDTGSFPEIGEGIGFIERHGVSGAKSSEYEFHFMFITGKILDADGRVTGVLATDLSEPSREHKLPTAQLPRSRNWNTQLYRSIAEMRGVAGPDTNAYPSDQYYSVLVRAVNEG